jgi:hypothetical protein
MSSLNESSTEYTSALAFVRIPIKLGQMDRLAGHRYIVVSHKTLAAGCGRAINCGQTPIGVAENAFAGHRQFHVYTSTERSRVHRFRQSPLARASCRGFQITHSKVALFS